MRLVEDEQLVVLVEDQPAQERRVGGVDLLRDTPHLRLEGRDAHLLALAEARIGPRPSAIDPHLPGADELLQVPEGDLRIVQPEPAVEPHAVLVARDGALLGPAQLPPRITTSPP